MGILYKKDGTPTAFLVAAKKHAAAGSKHPYLDAFLRKQIPEQERGPDIQKQDSNPTGHRTAAEERYRALFRERRPPLCRPSQSQKH
ncbi:MAG: hypothetical protein WCT31_04100 [Candidatus Micrarchaeia archaeon]